MEIVPLAVIEMTSPAVTSMPVSVHGSAAGTLTEVGAGVLVADEVGTAVRVDVAVGVVVDVRVGVIVGVPVITLSVLQSAALPRSPWL